jgi:acetyl-CoA acetyltransferase
LGERAAVITGLGQSALGRRTGCDALGLTVDAVLAAIDDAGLDPADIDGLASYPGSGSDDGTGFAGPAPSAVQDVLGLPLRWHHGTGDGPGQMGAIIGAALAVSAGLARHVAVYRTTTESSAQLGGRRAMSDVPADLEWLVTPGAVSAANWFGMVAQRHFHDFGTTREQLSAVALNARANAMRNPRAVYRSPLTLEQYLDARTISSPLCLYDCDVPIDGSTALIVSHVDTALDRRHPAARIEAVGTAIGPRTAWGHWSDWSHLASSHAASMLWERTDLKPADVDVAELYDGFSIIALLWLEALGLCGRGESGAFVEGGSRIATDGQLPLNTNGGQLSEGRTHGFGLIHEAVAQLRGTCGERQVPGAEVAVVTNAGGPLPLAGAMLLTTVR